VLHGLLDHGQQPGAAGVDRPVLTSATDPTALACLTSRSTLPNRDGHEVAVSELDDFLTTTLARQVEAEQALLNGDPAARMTTWSAQDPVTSFGQQEKPNGWDEVSRSFHWVAARSSNCPT
jgi:hypothetical protein